jgi:hypothetical protein
LKNIKEYGSSGKKKTHCSGKELLKEIRRSQTLQSKKSAFTAPPIPTEP